MPDIHDVMDVTMDDLSPEQRIQLKDAIDEFQKKVFNVIWQEYKWCVVSQIRHAKGSTNRGA
jgi:hypothetical protein